MPRSKLVGMNFRPMEAQIRALELLPGETVRLEAEPTNKYDPNAIKVFADTEQDRPLKGRPNDAKGLFLGYIIARDRQSEDLFLAADIEDPNLYSATVLSNGKSKDTIYLALKLVTEPIEEEAEAATAA